jgi:hypothetical protein
MNIFLKAVVMALSPVRVFEIIRLSFSGPLPLRRLQISAWKSEQRSSGLCRREAAQVSRKPRFRPAIFLGEKFAFQCVYQ